MERLTFNIGSSRGGPLVVAGRAGHGEPPHQKASPIAVVRRSVGAVRERYGWDYLWMLAFTALLFFRPQDQIPGLAALHLAELTAIGGLASMAVRRLSAGQTIAHINGELIGILALGAVLVLTIPFSFWPGGSLKLFSDVYVKIILIFALMISTITSPRRLRQMMWIMIVASGYLSSRAVFDYVRGVNLVEGDRVRGAVGGMFENPNDLALNLVTFLAPTLFVIFEDRKLSRRLVAIAIAGAMLAAIVCTKSRSGFLGLIAMGAVVLYYVAKVRPAVVVAALVAGLMMLPVMPESFWNRMDSIMNADEDASGSRAARLRLIEQGVEVFLENPVTGIGAGQFQNYNGPGAVEKWRVTHNVWLQVAAELGIFGFAAFAFLVVRAYSASIVTLRMLRRTTKHRNPPSAVRGPRSRARNPQSAVHNQESSLTGDERRLLDLNAKAMIAAMVGWTVCALFASVAFNWTFYYVLALAVAGREIVVSRRIAAGAAPATTPAPRMVRATA
jgi:O-antigen ligase